GSGFLSEDRLRSFLQEYIAHYRQTIEEQFASSIWRPAFYTKHPFSLSASILEGDTVFCLVKYSTPVPSIRINRTKSELFFAEAFSADADDIMIFWPTAGYDSESALRLARLQAALDIDYEYLVNELNNLSKEVEAGTEKLSKLVATYPWLRKNLKTLSIHLSRYPLLINEMLGALVMTKKEKLLESEFLLDEILQQKVVGLSPKNAVVPEVNPQNTGLYFNYRIRSYRRTLEKASAGHPNFKDTVLNSGYPFTVSIFIMENNAIAALFKFRTQAPLIEVARLNSEKVLHQIYQGGADYAVVLGHKINLSKECAVEHGKRHAIVDIKTTQVRLSLEIPPENEAQAVPATVQEIIATSPWLEKDLKELMSIWSVGRTTLNELKHKTLSYLMKKRINLYKNLIESAVVLSSKTSPIPLQSTTQAKIRNETPAKDDTSKEVNQQEQVGAYPESLPPQQSPTQVPFTYPPPPAPSVAAPPKSAVSSSIVSKVSITDSGVSTPEAAEAPRSKMPDDVEKRRTEKERVLQPQEAKMSFSDDLDPETKAEWDKELEALGTDDMQIEIEQEIAHRWNEQYNPGLSYSPDTQTNSQDGDASVSDNGGNLPDYYTSPSAAPPTYAQPAMPQTMPPDRNSVNGPPIPAPLQSQGKQRIKQASYTQNLTGGAEYGKGYVVEQRYDEYVITEPAYGESQVISATRPPSFAGGRQGVTMSRAAQTESTSSPIDTRTGNGRYRSSAQASTTGVSQSDNVSRGASQNGGKNGVNIQPLVQKIAVPKTGPRSRYALWTSILLLCIGILMAVDGSAFIYEAVGARLTDVPVALMFILSFFFAILSFIYFWRSGDEF
ncbi:MAG: hypothetical protein QW728_06000, partial [Thermoplasmata archaeon]